MTSQTSPFFHILRILAGLLFSALLTFGCSDDGISPDDGNGGNGSGAKDFAVVSLEQDSMYWNEEAVVILQNADSRAPFKMFLHTVEVPVLSHSVDHAGLTHLRVRIPENTQSNVVRVYDSANVEAKGNVRITILPRKVEFTTSVTHFMPMSGFPGDLVLIRGSHMPMRRRDIKAWYDSIPLQVLSFNDRGFQVRIPNDVTTGTISANLGGKKSTVGVFTIAEPYSRLLSTDKITFLEYYASDLIGLDRTERHAIGDVLEDSVIQGMTASTGYLEGGRAVVNTADSLIIDIDDHNSDGRVLSVRVRLKYEPDSRVSGTIRISNYHENINGRDRTTELEVKGIRWRKLTHQEYLVYAYGEDISHHIVKWTYFDNLSDPDFTKHITVDRSDILGSFEMKLWH